MPFSEDDLRSALRRKEPSADFTQQVLSRTSRHASRQRLARRRFEVFSVRTWPASLRWATCAVAACVFAGASLLYHRHEQRLEAEKAREQTILALRITDDKLTLVLQRSVLNRGILPRILEAGTKLQKEHL